MFMRAYVNLYPQIYIYATNYFHELVKGMGQDDKITAC
jgi:hypothetical protein